jgi:signal transduction histidine kinase
MRERVESLGGTFALDGGRGDQVGRGTLVRATLPLERAPERVAA